MDCWCYSSKARNSIQYPSRERVIGGQSIKGNNIVRILASTASTWQARFFAKVRDPRCDYHWGLVTRVQNASDYPARLAFAPLECVLISLICCIATHTCHNLLLYSTTSTELVVQMWWGRHDSRLCMAEETSIMEVHTSPCSLLVVLPAHHGLGGPLTMPLPNKLMIESL